MRGKKLIKTIDPELLEGLSKEYRGLILRKKIKENLLTVGEISARVLLVTGVLAGTVVLAAVAPNVIGAIGRLARNRKEKIYFNCHRKQFGQALSYLKNRHLIEPLDENGATSIRLTSKGMRRYHLRLLENMTVEKPKKWDRCWRIVIFDIPERFKVAREALREKLKNLGFYQIQKSVFAFPYPCEKEINFIRQLFGLEDQIRIVRATYFQGEQEVKRYFDLS